MGTTAAREKQTVPEENRDWQLVRHLSGRLEAAKWAGVQVAQGQDCARGAGGGAVTPSEPGRSIAHESAGPWLGRLVD